jgi:hypothetical protein
MVAAPAVLVLVLVLAAEVGGEEVLLQLHAQHALDLGRQRRKPVE